MSDGIYVIDVDGYIGADTQREIEYAKMLNKEIRYYSKDIIVKKFNKVQTTRRRIKQ